MTTVRIVPHGVVAVLAFLVGSGLGYFLWGLRITDLNRQIQRQQLDCTSRLSEAERRAKTAEAKAQREAEARRMVEEELQRVHPLK